MFEQKLEEKKEQYVKVLWSDARNQNNETKVTSDNQRSRFSKYQWKQN